MMKHKALMRLSSTRMLHKNRVNSLDIDFHCPGLSMVSHLLVVGVLELIVW